jgi:hypothetical protein
VDLPPEILEPEVEPGSVIELVFQAATETVTVVAQDPEEQQLTFVWEVPRGVLATPNTFDEEAGITVSILSLPADPVLHDSELHLAVFDTSGNDADLTWHLVIP